MMKAIAIPFGWLMLKFYELTGNYGLAVLLFAIVVNLILLPFMLKSKKGMMRQSRLQPRIAELQKKHEGNSQKLNAEISRLYREEHVNPMSGCLWSLIPFPILIALYYAIRMPITVMMRVPAELLSEGGAILTKLNELGFSLESFGSRAATYGEIYQAQFITQHFSEFQGLSDKLIPMNYSFLGIDLSSVPQWRLWQFDWSDAAVWLPALGLFLIPIISALMSYLSMKISTKTNPTPASANGQAASTNKTMMLMMPLMSIWICFIMPAALGVYWIFNSVLGIIRDVVLTNILTKKMDAEDAIRNAERKVREEEMERKRLETERMKALGLMEKNSNTSKKKKQAVQKQKDAERRAAAERAERAERRARLGIETPDEPESQVGNRRYARGRAYVGDRYEHPETAEAATEAAAAESEFGESIDEDLPDEGAYCDSDGDEAADERSTQSENASEAGGEQSASPDEPTAQPAPASEQLGQDDDDGFDAFTRESAEGFNSRENEGDEK